MADVTNFLKDRMAGINQHLKDYLETDGAKGYLRDMSGQGGSKVGTCLVLKTKGRKSGKTIFAPLLYAAWGDEYIIVASKGGADEHPAWYLNLTADPHIEFQVRDKRWSGTWREVEGAERQKIWDYVSVYFDGYRQYQEKTDRKIPVIVLTAKDRIVERWTLPEG